ncbi:MAG TPA: short-chain dehydrogenase, partial [Acidimicrobiaceae bacterium]|nr:short-chain dehydrogenase [Acidimicrobiaceae bacterium]
ARLLAEHGFTVGLVARRRDRLEHVLADCRRSAPQSRLWVADLSDLGVAEELAGTAWDEMGRLDVLINNAGVPMRRSVKDLRAEEVERVMRINFLSPVRMTLAVLPRMLERRRGVVVNVASLAGRIGVTTEAAYSASKFALSGWSEAMAADLFGTGVSVRLVLPGTIDTELWDQPGNDPPLYRGELTPAEDVAQCIADAIDGERFEHFLPDMKRVVEMKTTDIDGFLAAMVETARQWKEHA